MGKGPPTWAWAARALAITVAPVIPSVQALKAVARTQGPRLSEGPHCSKRHADEARELLSKGLFNETRSNPCVRHMIPSYEQRLEDPRDAVEFLGMRPSTPGCSKKMFPSVLYLGMEHAGSTTLADALDRHESLSYGKCKEHRYFTTFSGQSFDKTNEEYLDSFEVDCKVQRTFDGTPNTFALSLPEPEKACHGEGGPLGSGPAAVEQVRDLLGDSTQFLVMLRDPLQVIQSLSPTRGIDQHLIRSVRFCECFTDGLRAWMERFPREQFHFLRSEDLFAEPQQTLAGILDFLGVEPKAYSRRELQASGRRRGQGAKYDSPSESDLRTYRENVKPCHDAISALSGLKLDWLGGSSAL